MAHDKPIPFLRRLSTKYIATALLVAVAPLLVIYLVYSANVSNMLIKTLRSDLSEKSFFIGADIDRYFKQREYDTRILSRADVFEHHDSAGMNQYLAEIVAESPYLDDVEVIDRSGLVIASSGASLKAGERLADIHPDLQALFDQALQSSQGSIFVSDVLRLQGGPGLAFLAPVTDDSNLNVIMVLLVEINLDVVKKIVADFGDRVIGDKYVYLVNNDGNVIVTRDPTVELLAPFPDLEMHVELAAAFSKQGSVGSIVYTDATGDAVMAGYADMAELGQNAAMDWSIIAVAPIDEITRPVQKVQRTLLLTTVGVILLATLLLLSMSRRIVLALARIVDGARQVGGGDFSFRVFTDATDEFGQVARSVNHTMEILESNTKETARANSSLSAMNEKLRDAQSQLIHAAKLASVGEMATGIAHELNQPLTVIAMSADVQLQQAKRAKNDELEDCLELILNQIARASTIIDHLRTFGRDANTLAFTSHDINEVIRQSFIMINEQLRLAGVVVEFELTDDLKPVSCNAIQIEQVLTNLVMNAVDAMELVEHKKVIVRSGSNNDITYVEVQDFGKGIADEMLGKIFDPFHTDKEVGKGTGLGLSISYGIMISHGGALTATTEVGVGSTFRLELPETSKD